jgi:POT family proton-dependent oligopeptide transporter
LTTTELGTGLHGENLADPTGALHPAPDGDTAFFGHPRGLGFLAGTEMWERFSFYGMQALLMLYMTKYLLIDGRADKVIGLEGYRSVLSAIFGPMTNLALAAQTFGLYSGFILLTPLVGAYLGDRVLGRTKTITIGALLMAGGHMLMASEALFLFALLLLILGGGCFIGNLTAQIGGLYSPTDSRRTRAFGLYLVALNVGAFISPLIVGTLGEKVGFHYGFTAAGIGMLIGLSVYLFGRRHLPPDRIVRGAKPPPLTRNQWKVVGALVAAVMPKLLFNAAAQQAYGIMLIWADTRVDRTVMGWEMPVTWINTIDGILTIVGVFAAGWLWKRQARAGTEPDDLMKTIVGCVMVTFAFAGLSGLAGFEKVPLWGWIGFYLILDFSFAWFSPPMQALIARFAPPQVNGTMFAISSAMGALGFILLGWLGRFYEPYGPQKYFLLTAALPAAAAVLTIIARKPVLRLLEAGEADALRTMPPVAPPAVVTTPA